MDCLLKLFKIVNVSTTYFFSSQSMLQPYQERTRVASWHMEILLLHQVDHSETVH